MFFSFLLKSELLSEFAICGKNFKKPSIIMLELSTGSFCTILFLKSYNYVLNIEHVFKDLVPIIIIFHPWFFQVIAFTCCAITVILMLGSVSAADWVQSEGWREGLFSQCVKAGAPTPLPFGGDATPGCRKAHSAGYVRGAAALAIICFITDFFGTLLVGLGLRSTDPNKKYKYYRVAIYSLAVAGRTIFIIVYYSIN